MSKLFNHTTQPLGSSTSPVEDLALEVAEAFDQVAKIYDIKPRLIPSIKESIGDMAFDVIEPHGITKSFSETHNLTSRESSFTLKASPTQNTTTVSYIDPVTSQVVSLTEVPNTTPFTSRQQFKIYGKRVETSLVVPKHQSLAVSVDYTGKTYELGGNLVIANAFKTADGSYTIAPESVSGDTWRVPYNRDLTSISQELRVDPTGALVVFSTENGKDWQPVSISGYEVKDTSVEFTSADFQASGTTKVAVLANNTSLAKVLMSLYKEFVSHKHGDDELVSNIDSYSVANRVMPTANILYKSVDTVNYQYPQYLNREGHNPTLDSVYENAMLGDLFMARQTSGGSDRFKGLDVDSRKVIFGDPTLGHYINYSKDDKALQVSTVSNNNGLAVKLLDPTKWLLSLNSSTFYSTDSGLKISPQAGVVDMTGESGHEVTVKADKLHLTVGADITSYYVNKVKFQGSDNGVDAEFVPLPSTGQGAKLLFKLPVNFKSLHTDEFAIGKGRFAKDSEDNLKIHAVDDGKVLLDNIQILNGNVDNIKFGDVTFKLNSDNGLTVSGDGVAKLEAKVVANDLDIVGAEVKGKLKAGDVWIQPTDDKDFVIKAENDKKVIFEAPVELKTVRSGQDADIQIESLKSSEVTIGNQKLKVDSDDLKISTEVPESKVIIESDSVLKKATAKEITIEAGEIKAVKVGNSTLKGEASGNAVIEPSNPATDKLIIRTPTTFTKASANSLEVTEELTANLIDVSRADFGKVVLQEEDDNLKIRSEEDKKLLITAETVIDKAHIKSLVADSAELASVIASGLNVGHIQVKKDDASDSMVISRTDDESKVNITAPAEISDLTAGKIKSTGEVITDKLLINEVAFETVDEENIRISKPEGKEKLLTWAIKSVFKDLVAERITSPIYSLHHKDKIELDASNYITNLNNRLTIVHDKSMNLVGSGKATGLAFTREEGAEATIRAYISANAGTSAVPTEKNFFLESDATDGVFFLKDTATKINKDGVQFGFNDSTAQQSISDLTKWFRASVYMGNLEAYNAVLKTAEPNRRNGLRIGSTRLSVIGPGDACPEGLTTLESSDSIHFVKPLADGTSGCRDLTYQELSVGAVNAKGNLTVEGVATVSEDLIVSGAVASTELAVTGETELNTTQVAGEMTVGGKAIFMNEVEFRNPLTLRNDLTSEANMSMKGLETSNNAIIGKDLEVARDLEIGRDMQIAGAITARGGITSHGFIKSDGLDTRNFTADEGRVTADFEVSGNSRFGGTTAFNNKVDINSSLNVGLDMHAKGKVTADALYSIRDTYVRGALVVKDGATLEGNTISVGGEKSLITLNGKLQLNTSDVTLNSPLRVFNNATIAGDLDTTGKLLNKAGIEADSYLKVAGTLIAQSTADFQSEVKIRNLQVDQTIAVVGSITANSLTAESLAIDNLASIKSLNVTETFVTSNDTRISAGEASFSSLNVRDPKKESIFSGGVVITETLSVAKTLSLADRLIVGTDNVIIENSGIRVDDGKIHARTLSADEMKGTSKIQTPSSFNSSRNSIVTGIGNQIPQRRFVKIDNFAVEGLAVFTNTVVVDTLVFNNLVYAESEKDKEAGLKGLDILARRAVYA